jgi:SAM-dependent methyltransferase
MTRKPAFIQRDRRDKANMLEAIISDYLGKPPTGRKILDIGSGNGQISDHFLKLKNRVMAVDIADRRIHKDNGVEFYVVDSELLPFQDETFDIVISNHVIEHVKSRERHISEIRRVLQSDGICYLATPNRTSPFMEEHEGNDLVFRWREMRRFFKKHGFDCVEYGVKCAKSPKKFHIAERTPHFLPVPILYLLRPIFPSHMFILRHASTT